MVVCRRVRKGWAKQPRVRWIPRVHSSPLNDYLSTARTIYNPKEGGGDSLKKEIPNLKLVTVAKLEVIQVYGIDREDGNVTVENPFIRRPAYSLRLRGRILGISFYKSLSGFNVNKSICWVITRTGGVPRAETGILNKIAHPPFSPTAQADYNDFWHILRMVGFCLSFANSCANPVALYCVSGAFRKHFNRWVVHLQEVLSQSASQRPF